MIPFIVWTLWADRSEQLVEVSAIDVEGAVEKAARMGLVSGLGRDPRYLGLHATVRP